MAEKSVPWGPRDVERDIVAGMLSLEFVDFDFFVENASRAPGPRRSTSYPQSTNLPSGGTKLRSPGRSLHLLSLTQGWNAGREIVFAIPPGQDNWRMRSGIPLTFAVKAILPLAMAERGRPEGEDVMERVSRMST